MIKLSLFRLRFIFFKHEITSDKFDIFTYNISLNAFITVHYESNLTTYRTSRTWCIGYNDDFASKLFGFHSQG